MNVGVMEFWNDGLARLPVYLPWQADWHGCGGMMEYWNDGILEC